METARALTSSSNIARRVLCPGSANAEFGLPDAPSKIAQDGTLLHHHDANPHETRADLSTMQNFILDRNKEMRDKFIREQLDQRGIPHDAACKTFYDRDGKPLEFWLCNEDGIPLEPGVPGHPDIIYYWPEYRLALIWDSKFGRIPVTSAAANYQLRSYAVMVDEHFNCDEIIVAIGQPWLKAPQSLHAGRYTAENLPAYKSELLLALKLTEAEDAKRIPSLEACRFCRARGVCKEAQAIVKTFTRSASKPMSHADLEAMADDVALAEGAIEAWYGQMERYAAEGTLKDWELGKPKILRSVTNVADAEEALVRGANLVTQDEFEAAIKEDLSFPILEEALAPRMVAKTKKEKKDKAKSRIHEALGNILIEKPTKRSLQRKVFVECE